MELPDPEWRLLTPASPCGTGVLLLAGSSGRVDVDRAALLAQCGATVLAIRWFGGPGQQPGPFAVPLELFSDALDLLAPTCERLAIVGTSFGAEAALLVASRDSRVSAAIAFAPSSVVWPGYDGAGWTSHWTARGEPVPYLPFVPDWEADDDPPSYRPLYVRSLEAAQPDVADAATIRVERIAGSVLVVAGGDDRVWPSSQFADAIARRRSEHGLTTTVVVHPGAGHRALLPGEVAVQGGQRMARGGTPDADAVLGELAWPHLVEVLDLHAGAADG